MSDTFFSLYGICFASLLGFLGILMLIGSEKSTRLLYKVLQADKFLAPNVSSTKRQPLQWRMAGLALTALSICFLVVPLYWDVSASANDLPKAVDSPVTGRWLLLGMLVVAFLFGLFLFIRPRGIVQLSKLIMPGRVFPDSGPPSGFVLVRLIGMCFVAFSVYAGLILFKR
jgi:hypothetical protein